MSGKVFFSFDFIDSRIEIKDRKLGKKLDKILDSINKIDGDKKHQSDCERDLINKLASLFQFNQAEIENAVKEFNPKKENVEDFINSQYDAFVRETQEQEAQAVANHAEEEADDLTEFDNEIVQAQVEADAEAARKEALAKNRRGFDAGINATANKLKAQDPEGYKDKLPKKDYNVVKGDSLWKIAERLLKEANPDQKPSNKAICEMIAQIAILNDIKSVTSYPLRPGNTIKVPGEKAEEKPEAKPEEKPEAKPEVRDSAKSDTVLKIEPEPLPAAQDSAKVDSAMSDTVPEIKPEPLPEAKDSIPAVPEVPEMPEAPEVKEPEAPAVQEEVEAPAVQEEGNTVSEQVVPTPLPKVSTEALRNERREVDESRTKVEVKEFPNHQEITTKYDEYGDIVSVLHEYGEKESFDVKEPVRHDWRTKPEDRVSVETQFDKNGQKTCEIERDVVGDIVKITQFDEEGKVIFEEKFNMEGEPEYVKKDQVEFHYDENGKATAMVELDKDENPVRKTSYDENGKIEIVTEYGEDGKAVRETYFNPNEETLVTDLNENLRIKKSTTYNSDTVSIIKEYNPENPKLFTRITTFDENGIVRSIHEYDEIGRVVKQHFYGDDEIKMVEYEYDGESDKVVKYTYKYSDGKTSVYVCEGNGIETYYLPDGSEYCKFDYTEAKWYDADGNEIQRPDDVLQ